MLAGKKYSGPTVLHLSNSTRAGRELDSKPGFARFNSEGCCMSGKKNWGNIRMDGETPPPFDDTHAKVAVKSWRGKYDCPKAKGNHQWELVIPEYCRTDRTGRVLNIGVEEYYIREDAKYYEEKEEHARRVAAGELTSRWSIRFWGGRRRSYECVHCHKHASDYEDKPDKKIRANLCTPKK